MVTAKKLGLVLSGGGARGAYQVGVVRYLAEQGITPDAYAGASIGALNGAFLAASPDIIKGAQKLEEVWKSLRNEKIVRVNRDLIVLGLLMTAAEVAGKTYPEILTIRKWLQDLIIDHDAKQYLQILRKSPLLKQLKLALLDNGFLHKLLTEVMGKDHLDSGKPLWISVYPSSGLGDDLLSVVLAEVGWIDTASSKTFLLQSLPKEERIQALMASAAVPLAYKTQTIQGNEYADGGLGGWKKSQGNTPIQPLIAAGCDVCIVTHLSDGSLWDRHDYPGTQIIEVRPSSSLHPEGGLMSLMNFDPVRIEEWIKQGYQDAKRCIGNLLYAQALSSVRESMEEKMEKSLSALDDEEFDSLLNMRF